MTDKIKVEKSLHKLMTWMESNNYRAFDPFDGLSSWLNMFTFQNKKMKQLLIQGVRRAPFNIRPFIGIKPHTSTKGMGFLASGYINLFRLYHQSIRLQPEKRFYIQLVVSQRMGHGIMAKRTNITGLTTGILHIILTPSIFINYTQAIDHLSNNYIRVLIFMWIIFSVKMEPRSTILIEFIGMIFNLLRRPQIRWCFSLI